MAAKKEASKQQDSKALAIPDYLKGVQTSTNEMSSGITTSVPRVSLKGRRFRFVDGEEEIKVEGPVDVVILGVEPRDGLSKTWYEKAYNPSSNDPPDCSSWDGVRPDSWVNKPQSRLCADCPQAQWGSAKSMSGKKAKACKESKRLIIALADNVEGTQYVLTVTISSLKALSTYGKWLAQNQLPFSAVVTTLSFVDADFPELEFEFKEFLEEEDGKMAMSIAQERPWDSMINSGPALPEPEERQALAAPKTQPSNDALHPAEAASAEDVDKIIDNW
jgi:hypothetical protein